MAQFLNQAKNSQVDSVAFNKNLADFRKRLQSDIDEQIDIKFGDLTNNKSLSSGNFDEVFMNKVIVFMQEMEKKYNDAVINLRGDFTREITKMAQ